MRTAWLVVVCALAATGDAVASSGEGRLVARHDGEVIDVPLEHTDVHIRVDGLVAEATVTQRFRNPYPAKIEAVYLFPLPTDAAVSALVMVTNGRTIRGSIQERARATRVYEAARRQGLVAALLTQERPNLFTQSIANLEPAAAIDVTLHYVQRLAYDNGGYELVFPMVATPRYVPASSQQPAAAVQAPTLPAGLRSSHDISLAVEVDAGVPIEAIASSSHQVAIGRPAPSRATVQIQPSDAIPNKDFVLRYQVAGAAPRFGVVAHRDGGEGSVLLVAQPPAAPAASQIAPRELVFVLDTSSSMRGAPLATAKQLIRSILGKLRPDDTFQVVRFDDRASPLGPAPIANKPTNIARTLDWLGALEASGGTEMIAGIEAALAVPHDPARLRIVAFVTDGYVGNEDAILALVGGRLGAARLFSFGVGSAVNRYLLEELAAFGRGAAQVVRPDDDPRVAVNLFERRIDAAVLTDVQVDWGALAVRDAVPQPIPDLFVGQPVVIAGHYATAGSGVVTVRGKRAGREVRFQVPVTLPERAPRPAIATVWARQRIAELTRRLVRKHDPAIEREIVELSLAHRVLTRFTAFVAVDESRVTTGMAQRVVVPVEVPEAARAVTQNGLGSSTGSGFGIAAGTIGHGTIGYGGGGMRARIAAAPVVEIAQPVVEGALDKAIIRRYVRRQLNKITYCYERRLVALPGLAGTVVSHFAIGPSGSVVASTADGLGDPEVEACIADVVQSIEFPKVASDVLVQVNYPFTLKPPVRTP